MRDATKWLCGLLVALMALTGPLLSRAAVVQAAELSPGVDVEVSDGDRVGAGFPNGAYVPGKAIGCGLGTVVSAAVMIGRLGSAYPAPVPAFKTECAGPRYLRP